MEGGNKFVKIVILVLAGLLVAVSIVFCVTMAVGAAMGPMAEVVQRLVIDQKDMNKKITAGNSGDMSAVLARVAALETEVQRLKSRRGPEIPSQPAEDMNRVYDLKIGDSYVAGNPEAPVTIVEFSDFQCPFCARFHPVIQEVLKAFPKDVDRRASCRERV